MVSCFFKVFQFIQQLNIYTFFQIISYGSNLQQQYYMDWSKFT